MHITLWQQFSSNHSGGFSVVGRFATEEAAREAVEKLREIVRRIDEWHEDPGNKAWYNEQARKFRLPITPVEREISKEYQVDWGNAGVDWYGGMIAPILQVGRDVYFSTAESWAMPTPIVNLLTLFGGQTAQAMSYEDEPIESIWVKLTCAFDTELNAQEKSTTIASFMQPSEQLENKPSLSRDYGELYLKEGTVSAKGNKLYLDFRFYGLKQELPALVEWLKNNGARDIDYTFETRSSDIH